jgi:tetratricopeptide (TPR) repeat protein/tRNA A-37 threonylcarbamoyl transferase component Bud32
MQFAVHRAFPVEQTDPPPTRVVPPGLSAVVPFAGSAADFTVSGGVDAATFAPGYEVLEVLGRGGMGIVFKARQQSLNRLVALKMTLAGVEATAAERARFRTEAEAVARLRHPNIVQVYEITEQGERPYFSLELVEGGSLAKKLAGTPQPPRAAAELIETLARAMHHAHEQGILHRDLKPSNVLLTADGVPKITDFGLAKLLDVQTGHTPTEAVLGTPSYMAPEQAAGHVRDVGPAADVYSLGAILYEMLTGLPPFKGATLLDTLEQVRSQEPVPPSRLQPRVPRDLETVCLKCLQKEPRQRYASARDLADELRRFLAGESVLARPAGAGRRLLKWVRRRPAVASLVAVSSTAALLLAGLGLAHYGNLREQRAVQRQLAEETARRDAQTRRQRFLRWRDEGLFQGIHGTVFTGSDAAAGREAAREAARRALAELHAGPGTAPPPEPYWTEQERGEVLAGAYELLLVLAETRVQGADGRPAAPDRETATQALRDLDTAAALGLPPTRTWHLRRARYLELLGDEPAARLERQQAEALPPAGLVDHFLAGAEHYRQGDFEQAARDFEQALARGPDHFWSQFSLALCHLALHRPAEASLGLTACLGRRPDFLWAYLLRGSADLERGDLAAAERDCEEARRRDPPPDARYALYIHRGALRTAQGDYARARADLDAACRLEPQRYHPHLNLALLYRRQHQDTPALDQITEALRFQPPAPARADLLGLRGEILLGQKRYPGALAASTAALAVRPDHARAQGVRGRALLALGRHEEAARSFTSLIEQGGPAAAQAHLGRGQAREKLGQYAAAVSDYTVGLEGVRGLTPAERAEVCNHRGWAYFFTDAWQLALADFEEALRGVPGHVEALVGRGLARVMLGRYREAVADAEEALGRRPVAPEMLHNVACIFAQAAGKVRADPAAANATALAARYGERAVDALRRALELLRPEQRLPFWRATVFPDPALDPIRQTRGFKQLAARYPPAAPPR